MLRSPTILSRFAAITCAFVLTAAAVAGDYYVSPSGVNSGAGGVAQPWRTIGYALPRIAGGDTLHVLAGTYNESNTLSGRRGTQAAPIVIRGEPGAVIDATGEDGFLIWQNCQWIIVEGLEITGAGRAGVLVGQGSSNVTIRDCHIHDNRVWQVQSTLASHVTVERCRLHGSTIQHGIYFATTDYPIARDNIIYDNVQAGIHINGDLAEGGDGMITNPIVERNIIYNNGASGASGINMDGAEGAWVAGNLLYNNRAGGITSYCISGAHAGAGNRFFFNTVYFAPGKGRFGLQLVAGSRDAIVRNNIFICGNAALEVDSASLPGLSSDNNIFVRHGSTAPITLAGSTKSLAAWRTATGQDALSLGVAPVFADIAGGDFRLQQDSPGVDDGAEVGGITVDLDGQPRFQGAAPDIGAYERADDGTTSTTDDTTTTSAPTTTTTVPPTTTTTTLPAISEAVIDNRDGSPEKWFEIVTGTLRTSASYTGYYGQDYAHLSTASGAATERARWSCVSLPAGEYEVYAWWSAAKTRSRSAPYVIKNGATVLAEVRVDQTLNGGAWRTLGTYTFGAGQHIVEMHNGASKVPSTATAVCADAVRFVRIGSSPTTTAATTTTTASTTSSTVATTTTTTLPVAAEAVIDNRDGSPEKWFEIVTGTLRTSASYTGYYGQDYAHLSSASGAAMERARWSCVSLPAGEYEVCAWWSAAKTRSRSAPYVIKNGATVLAEVRVDQTLNGGAWRTLGTYTFSAGQHIVEMHNGASKVPSTATAVCADAVRFVRVGP